MTEPSCPNCRGYVAVVLKRAWCLKPYADGGCGGYWSNWPRGMHRPRPGGWLP